MPSYDYECEHGHRSEKRSTIALRAEPRLCRVGDCEEIAELVFTLSNPDSLIASPANSQTRWADIAPIDPETNQLFNTPGEAFKSGGFAPYDERMGAAKLVEDKARHAARDGQYKRDAPKRAWKRYQNGDVPEARPAVDDSQDTWIAGKSLAEGGG